MIPCESWMRNFRSTQRKYCVRFLVSYSLTFLSSKKQYNTKLRQWGFHKKISGAMATWMATKANSRKREGKETKFTVGGQPWTMDRIERSAKRAKLDPEEADQIGMQSSTITPPLADHIRQTLILLLVSLMEPLGKSQKTHHRQETTDKSLQLLLRLGYGTRTHFLELCHKPASDCSGMGKVNRT
jgi:hypothetical protein